MKTLLSSFSEKKKKKLRNMFWITTTSLRREIFLLKIFEIATAPQYIETLSIIANLTGILNTWYFALSTEINRKCCYGYVTCVIDRCAGVKRWKHLQERSELFYTCLLSIKILTPFKIALTLKWPLGISGHGRYKSQSFTFKLTNTFA